MPRRLDAERPLISHRVAVSHILREEYIGFQVIDGGLWDVYSSVTLFAVRAAGGQYTRDEQQTLRIPLWQAAG